MGRWDAELPYLAPGRGASPSADRPPLRAPSGSSREPSPGIESSSSSDDGRDGLPNVEDIYDLTTAQLAAIEEQLACRVRDGSALPRESRIHELVRVELSERRGVEEIGLALVGGRLDFSRIPDLVQAPAAVTPASLPNQIASLRDRRSAQESAANRPPPLDAPSPSSSSRSLPCSARSFGAGITSAASTGATPTGSERFADARRASGRPVPQGLGPGCEPGFKPTRVELDFVIGGSSVKKKPVKQRKKPEPASQNAKPPLAPAGRQPMTVNKVRQTNNHQTSPINQEPQRKKTQNQQNQQRQDSRDVPRRVSAKASPGGSAAKVDASGDSRIPVARAKSMQLRRSQSVGERFEASKGPGNIKLPQYLRPVKDDGPDGRVTDGACSSTDADGGLEQPFRNPCATSRSHGEAGDLQSSVTVVEPSETLTPRPSTGPLTEFSNEAPEQACSVSEAIEPLQPMEACLDTETFGRGDPAVRAQSPAHGASADADMETPGVEAAGSQVLRDVPDVSEACEEAVRRCPECSNVIERARDRFCAECGCRLPVPGAVPSPPSHLPADLPCASGGAAGSSAEEDVPQDSSRVEGPHAVPDSSAPSASADQTPAASICDDDGGGDDDLYSGEEADDDPPSEVHSDRDVPGNCDGIEPHRSGSAPVHSRDGTSAVSTDEVSSGPQDELRSSDPTEMSVRPASARATSAAKAGAAAKSIAQRSRAAGSEATRGGGRGGGRGYTPGVPESLRTELKQNGYRDGATERVHARRPPLPHDALQPHQREPRARGHELHLNGLDPALVESGGLTNYADAFPSLVSMFTWGLQQTIDSSKRETYLREAMQVFQQFCDLIGTLEQHFKTDLAPADHATPNATQQALNAMDSRGAGLYGIFLKGIIDKLPGGSQVTSSVPRAPSAPRNVFSLRYYKVVQNRTEVYDIVTRVFHRKEGWEELPHGLGLANAWNLLWTWSKPKLEYGRLCTWQKVNHYPENKHLTRKDCLKRCIERYTRGGGRIAQYFHIMPRTFVLPKEYCLFIECFARIAEGNEELGEKSTVADDAVIGGLDVAASARPSVETTPKPKNPNLWIMKPAGSSRGRGISVISDVGSVHYGELTIIQQYLSDPFLIDGYKWDMRTYVTVTSFNPLEAFIYKDGFARFATVPYSNDPSDVDNKFVHLTNSSIQRHNEDTMMQDANVNDLRARERQRDALLGGTKINYSMLRQRLEARGVDWNLVWSRMIEVVLKSLLMAEDHIPHQVNSFELFGYDLFLDSKLRVWLIEVNSSPSMGQEHLLDEQVKQPLISDTIELVDPPVFNRQKLAEVLHRRTEKKASPGASTRKQLDVDLHAILDGQLPRRFGEPPAHLGNYERIAPSEAAEAIAKTRGLLFSR